MRYDTQQLLFQESPYVNTFRKKGISIPELFYEKGYAVVDGIRNADEALDTLQRTLSNIDKKRLPFLSHFLPSLQLAKADLIPVCADVLASSFQILHLDMGQPFISEEPQGMYFVTGLYAPVDTKIRKAHTRLLPLRGLFTDIKKWGTKSQIEKKIINYVTKYGDGWADVNTYRLAAFVRLIDAIQGGTDLATARDLTMGQWFRDEKNPDASLDQEYKFLQEKGLDIADLEEQVQLQSGQLLFFDNTHVVHGRDGRRAEKEVYQFIFGVEEVRPTEIDLFRNFFISLLTEK